MSSLGSNTDNFISIESPFINTYPENNNNKFLLIIIFIIIVVLFIIFFPWDKLVEKKKEHMTGGTLTQLYSNDSQDVYLKGDVDQLATGNYNLYWNQPTRVANTFLNRGSPLPSIVLPNTSMNPNNITLNNLEYQSNEYMPNSSITSNNSRCVRVSESKLPSHRLNFGDINLTKYENDSPRDKLWQNMQDNLLYNKDCLRNPASCGDGPGGYRLGEGYDQGTKAKPYVDLNGNIIYPDSYVGDYFIKPNFDIMQPFPIITKPKYSALNE